METLATAARILGMAEKAAFRMRPVISPGSGGMQRWCGDQQLCGIRSLMGWLIWLLPPMPAGSSYPVRRNSRDGTWTLRAGGQSSLPAQSGLGRGRSRRLHVAKSVLPAGLLCRRSGEVSIPSLQRRKPAYEPACTCEVSCLVTFREQAAEAQLDF